MNFGGIKKISIYDPLTGTAVQLNNIGTEGDFKNDPMSVENGKGAKQYSGDNYSFEFESLDNTGYDKLREWMTAQTPVNLVALGVDTHILWLADTLITVDNQYKFKVGELNGFKVKVEKKGGELGIYSGVNILKIYDFQDANNNGKIDNYDIQPSGLNGTFSNNTQTLVTQGAGAGAVQFGIKYPISGAALRFRFNSATHPQDVDITITCQNFAGSVLSTKSGEVNSNIDFATPAGMYKLYIAVNFVFAAAGESISFTQPYLGIQDYEGE